MKEHLTSDRTASLASAVHALNEAGVDVKKTSVWRMTLDAHVSYKRVQKKSDAVLTPAVIQKRFEYATIVSEIPDNLLLFLDETGFNLHLGMTRSWAEVGETPTIVVPANRGQNVSAAVCISTNGVRHVMIKDGAFNRNDFIAFLTDLIERCPELQHGEATIVMDNARIHHALVVVDFLEEKAISYLFLPPYTPELNPIENFFGTVKQEYCNGGVARTRNEMKRRIEATMNSAGGRV